MRIGLALVLVMSTLTVSAAPVAQPADAEAAIRAVVQQYQDAVLKRSPDKGADAFASDAVFMPNDGPAAAGRDSIRSLLNSTGEFRSFTMTPAEVTVLGELAIVRTENAGEVKSAEGWQHWETKSLFLFRHIDKEGWKIYRYMWNPNQP